MQLAMKQIFQTIEMGTVVSTKIVQETIKEETNYSISIGAG